MMKDKRLYLSRDKKLMGVCGGIAEYFEVDPTLVRLAFVFFGFFYGSGLLGYIAMGLIIPKRPID